MPFTQVCRAHGRSRRYTMTGADLSTAVCCRCTEWSHRAGVRVSVCSYECRPWREGRRWPERIQCGSRTQWHRLGVSGCGGDTWSRRSLKTWPCRSRQNRLGGDKRDTRGLETSEVVKNKNLFTFEQSTKVVEQKQRQTWFSCICVCV